MKRTVIAVSMGDPAGVGPEIALASMADAEVWERGTPLLVGDLSVLEAVKEALGMKMRLRPVEDPADAAGSPESLPVIDLKIDRKSVV